jgi:hypothetical protein
LAWAQRTSLEEMIRLMVDADLDLIGLAVPQKEAG